MSECITTSTTTTNNITLGNIFDNSKLYYGTTTTSTPTITIPNYGYSIQQKELQEFFDVINNHISNSFKDIKEIVPYKVYEFTFLDGVKIKTIKCDSDTFDLEYMFYLALAKKLYSKTLTFEGVLNKIYQLQYEKKYVKLVKKGIKLFNKLQKEKIEKEEQEALKKRQHEKYVRKKEEAKKRKEDKQIAMIAKAIRLSKEEG